MSSSSRRLRNRRFNLWMKDPRCYICKRLTIDPDWAAKCLGVDKKNLFTKGFPPDELRQPIATIDHFVSKYNRKERRKPTTKERTALCCWGCNDKRAKDEAAQRLLTYHQQAAKNHPAQYVS
jgi:hypothetical protein